MIRPHTRPSRTRRTAEVDHRRSGTDFVWKNIGFRASAISQKRISCETSFKTPSATHPPAPLAIPFTLRERSYSCKSQWNSVDRTCTKNTWNPIYNAEPIRPWSDHGPRMIRPWSENDPTTHETVSHPSHRRGRSSTFGDALCLEKHRVSCICYLSKTHFVRDFLQNSIGNSSTSTTCNPIYIAGTILQLQITMEFCRPHMHEKHLKPHLQCGTDPTMIRPTMVREWSDHGPRMIRPHTRPSRTRRTAEVDHRRSGTHFVWKNTGFRASAISQKRISCETSFKTPSATHPPAPLAIPFTLRERSYSCKSQWNSVDCTCTKNTWNPIYNAEPIRPWSDHGPRMIRPWSENDPTTHETVSHPSHRRGRSSTFGDALCLEKHRVSCICYLSKTHFVRDFLQNSIGNSSTSTTCNPIYIAGTILQLQITMEFCRPHMHEKYLKPHLQCGTDPTMTRPWSENDPTMVREWSDHTRDRLAPVAPQR